ncbi:MAG: hypothetical protein IT559_00055 [Alphaproteobacteria bacterium]|nr:hypothetical protein [Alphaproteobacteria bacterium]
MKVTFDIECSPEEARRFFGLPDVAPMQEAVMKEIERKMMDNIKAMDPESMMKNWAPMAIQNWNEMQKMFWNQVGASTGSAKKPAK